MKKHSKLLALCLACIMMMQVVPITASGDTATAGEYAPSQSVNRNTTGEETLDASTTVKAASGIIEEILWKPLNDTSVGVQMADGCEITENVIHLTVKLRQAAKSVTVVVDGMTLTGLPEDTTASYEVELLNGLHNILITINDGDRIYTERMNFSVKGGAGYPQVSLAIPQQLCLGETKTISLAAEHIEDMESIQMQMHMSKKLKVKNVQLADGVVGGYVWFGGNLRFDLRIVDPSVITGNALVTLELYAPIQIGPTEAPWTAASVAVVYKEASSFGKTENFIGSVNVADAMTSIPAQYTVSGWNYAVTGSRYAVFIEDAAGNPAANVSIYEIIGQQTELLGVTDTDGKFVATFTEKGVHELYAVDGEDRSSAIYSVKAYEAVGEQDGTPYMIQYAGFVTGGKSITWMSNYNAAGSAAQVRLATREDMKGAVVIRGVSNYMLYESSLSINRVNEVILGNLDANTTFYYQVGDGKVWSEVASFQPKTASAEINIALLGDLRGDATENLDLVAQAIRASGVNYDFAIRTGAVFRDTLDYDSYAVLASPLFLGGMDIIHTATGNEFDNAICNRVFSTKQKVQHYVYGDVYVAVINSVADANELDSMLKAIAIEAKNNGSKWQILSIGDAQTILDESARRQIEIAGIDLVISGTDCNYFRTESIRCGEVTEKNGVTYMSCGSMIVKEPIENPESYVASSDSYNALYVSLTVTADQLTAHVYNVLPDGSTVEIDTLVKTHFVCAEGDHVYRIDQNQNDLLVCEVCDHTRSMAGYVGFIGISRFYMFYDNGTFTKGWINHNGRLYYVDESVGVARDGEITVNGHTFLLKNYILVEGAWVEENGTRKLLWGSDYLMNTWHTQAGVTYYFLADGTMATGVVEITSVDEQGVSVVETYVFDENGALIGLQENA